MLELGQPLHAFDYDTLTGGRIVVRLARAGERIVTIDGTEVALDPRTLVIAAAARPVAIAGVMGGRDTEVTEATTDILLESAYFDPVSVRRTSKAIPLSTAASYRFERHVDPEGTLRAADRAAALLVELAGGEVSETVVDCQPRPFAPRRVRLRPDRCRAMLGMEVSDPDMRRHLEALELRVEEGSDAWEVTVPLFRADLSMEADLVEEVGRLAGYDRLPETLSVGPTQLGRRSPLGRLTRRLREQLLAQGLYEAVGHTLVSRGLLESTRLLQSPAWPAPAGPATLRNPLSEEYNTLRPSLLPGLLLGVLYNIRRDQEEVFLFEVGWAHAHPEDRGERDRLIVAGVMAGSRWAGAWNTDREKTAADFYACKGVVEAIAADLGLGPLQLARTQHPAFHPGRAADVRVGDLLLGTLGELHPEVGARLELPPRLQMFELDAQALLPYAEETRRYRAPSRFPAVRRDLAVVVDRTVEAEALRATIAAADPQLVREVRLFDLYSGRPLPEEKVSLAFAVQLESEERTLTDAEVDAVLARAREALAQRFRAEFRG
jgi:phenylalanyl-tRNA synthetase beta chain